MTQKSPSWYSGRDFGQKRVQNNYKGLGTYGTLGLEIVLGFLLPAYAGSLADEHWQTGNTFLLVGFALGIAHGVRAVWRALQRANREAEAEEAAQKDARKDYHNKRS